MEMAKQNLSKLAAFVVLTMLMSMVSFLVITAYIDCRVSKIPDTVYITQTASMSVPSDTESTGRHGQTVILSGDGADRGIRADLCFSTAFRDLKLYSECRLIALREHFMRNAVFDAAGVVMLC